MSSSSPHRPPWRRVAAVSLGAFLALAAACGKKGDPEPPLLPVPQAVSDLGVQQRGDRLILRFGYPRTTTAGLPLPELDRIEVFELVRPAVRPLPPPPEETDEETGEETGEEESAADLGTEPPGEGEQQETVPDDEPDGARPTASEPDEDRWVPPVVDAQTFTAGATPRTTLRGDELTAAVRGDQVLVELPLAAGDGPSAAPGEPPPSHFFAVRTAAGDYVSAFSNRPAILPTEPPPPPRGLELTARADGVAVAWEPVVAAEGEAEGEEARGAAGVEGYNLYRRLGTERDFDRPLEPVRGAASDGIIDRRARYGGRYVYAVTSVLSRRPLVESGIVQTAEVHYRDTFAPPPPDGLVALADEGGIRLLWNAGEADDLAGYRIYRRAGAGPWEPLLAEPTLEVDYEDASARPGIEYGYRVTAVDAAGNESEPGDDAVTAIPAPPPPAEAPAEPGP